MGPASETLSLSLIAAHSPTTSDKYMEGLAPRVGGVASVQRYTMPSQATKKRFVFLFFFFFAAAAAVLHPSAAASTPDNATDLAALLAFKSRADTGGVLSSSWVVPRGGDADFCSGAWEGVACSAQRQRVTELSLPLKSLTGSIPPHIGNLSFLVSLDLSGNDLSGPLPAAAFARLRRLRYLNLSDNSLTGSVPAELGGLTRLQHLKLNKNRLSGTIPEALGRLPGLQHLYLQGNLLDGAIPGGIFRIASLTAIALGNNMFSGSIPEDIHLPNVTYLALSRNALSGRIPRALGLQLTSLQTLYLSDNPITGEIPSELGSLSQLQDLQLDRTNLTGTIPPVLGNLTNLQYLSIKETQIKGNIPDELGMLANLVGLYLAGKRAGYGLSGRFPTAVYNMSSLELLILSQNNLSGNLPSDLGLRLPPMLQELYLSENRFAGEIPSSLSNASMLSILELSYNRFQGTVPPELGALQQLVNLTVTDNNLSGRLDFLGPLTGCRNLLQLNLRNNNFNGTLPASAIGNFTKLERFVGQSNFLEGSIPPTFGNLTNLTTLVLGYNLLSGPVPPPVVALPKLERLYLDVNRLEGRIPLEIGGARRLGLLLLQGNELSGPIPNSIGNLTAMQQMNLADNELSSAIPPGLWRLTELTDLNLSHNALEGSLPDTMKSFSKVTQLDLSDNRLSGGIPETIVDMEMLTNLGLASNNFSGPLPSGLGSLVSLETLDVSSNSLSGNIPPSMAKLRYLERLNLSFNNLEGEIPKGGVFAQPRPPGISNESFAGNPALCGDPWSGLPPCKGVKKGKGKRHKFAVALTSAAAAAAFLVVVLLAFSLLARRRKKAKNKKGSTSHGSFLTEEDKLVGLPMISRHELAVATNGFSEANLVGAGSFGKVYRGRLADGTVVAVKVLDLDMGEAAWRSFDAECRVMRTVRHRNLVGIITSCSNLDFRALVLPFMPNGSLERWIHPTGDGDDEGSPRLSLAQRVGVAADLAVALEYLHHGSSEPVLHCDLKPSNVLLDAQMVAHLGDFGIAKVLAAEQQSKSATASSMPGTFGYMAPEYGTAGRATTKGDVYSYGILLLETFTAVRPTDARFAGDTNLRRWVASAFPDALEDVVDDHLPAEDDEDPREQRPERVGAGGRGKGHDGERRKREQRRRRAQCLVAVVELGLNCSSESPKERPDMVEVTARVRKIREELLSPS